MGLLRVHLQQSPGPRELRDLRDAEIRARSVLTRVQPKQTNTLTWDSGLVCKRELYDGISLTQFLATSDYFIACFFAKFVCFV